MTGMLTTLTSQSAALRHNRRILDAVWKLLSRKMTIHSDVFPVNAAAQITIKIHASTIRSPRFNRKC